MKTKIFVSYRSKNSVYVDPIVHKLRSIGYDVWQDKEGIGGGLNWWEAICKGIKSSDVFLFMVSSESVKSVVCLKELEYATKLNMPIIPCVVKGEWQYDEEAGKYTISFWDEIPTELSETNKQFLFDNGAEFITRLRVDINALLQKNLPRFDVEYPPDPFDSSNSIEIYSEAYDSAMSGKLEQAMKLYLRLVNREDPLFSKRSLRCVKLIQKYNIVSQMSDQEATRIIAREHWEEYITEFPEGLLNEIFDPHGISEKLSKKVTLHTNNMQLAEIATSFSELMPELFTWIEIDSGIGVLHACSDKGDEIYLNVPTEPYAISKYPITNAQYAKFVDAGGYQKKKWWLDVLDGWEIAGDKGWTSPLFWKNRNFNAHNQPVVGVSWYEAMAFCAWLSDETNEEITLPTEAQWQYASQGGDDRAYPWGDEWHDTMCCHSHNSGGRTTPVTQYDDTASEHPFGVADIVGNMWEWTLTRRTPNKPDRICRGGSWEIYSVDTFRCNHRLSYGTRPDRRSSSRGFRIVRNS